MGGRVDWDSGRRDNGNKLAVLHRRPKGGVQLAQGKYISQPSALRKVEDRAEVDEIER